MFLGQNIMVVKGCGSGDPSPCGERIISDHHLLYHPYQLTPSLSFYADAAGPRASHPHASLTSAHGTHSVSHPQTG